MTTLIDILNQYQSIIYLAIIILIIILLLIEILNRIELNRIEKRYRKLMKGSTGKNLEDMIYEHNKKVEEALSTAEAIQDVYKDVDKRLKGCIQKFSVVRYRAFDDVGSDLSFSIALLDDKNDGVVITGIYGRSECTTFAKPIENGISKYDLSDEEKSALKEAIRKN